MPYEVAGEVDFGDDDFNALWDVFTNSGRLRLVTPEGRECEIMITKMETRETLAGLVIGGITEIRSVGAWRDAEQ